MPYFQTIANLNRTGYNSLESILEESLRPASIHGGKKSGSPVHNLILDTRKDSEFESEFIPGSIHLGLDGNFECLAASVLDPSATLLVVADAGKEREVMTRLAGIGYERIAGYLEGGITQWKKDGGELDQVRSVLATDFESTFIYGNSTALDVRNREECISGIVAGARLIPLSQLNREALSIDRNKTCYLYCVSGYRSIVAASLLKRLGFGNVVNVTGGMNEIRKTAMPLRQLSI
jgi:rhodanese-related sulfurtransferase